MTSSTSAAPWSRVAAAGTDPARLERAVARLTSTPSPRLAELARREVDAGNAEPGDVLDRLTAAPSDDQRRTAGEAARVWAGLGVRVALAGDPAYPRRLADGWPHTLAPPLLAVRGPAEPWPDRPVVAIVGARRATPYGTGVAAWLAEAAADAGAMVVSGGAVGIDAAAHGAASGLSGGTAVVLGCGHDVPYPRRHAQGRGALFERILSDGGRIVSEFLPGTPPRPPNVRTRNRVVAALADVVVVVEGSARSGSLVTAGVAAELGVPVMAVPGDVRAPGSAAPHVLLRDGAHVCAGPEDLLGLLGEAAAPEDAVAPSVLPADVRAALTRRWPRPVRLDDLVPATGRSIGALMAAVTRAHVAGEIVESPEGLRLARPPREGDSRPAAVPDT